MWYMTAERSEMVKVAALGVIAGLLTPLLAWGLTQLLIIPVFCSGGSDICAASETIGYDIAALMVAAAATAILAAQNVYRPLLIALGATVALWGLGGYVTALVHGSWVEYYLFSVLLYAIAYLASYWLLRLRHFALSIAGLLAIVVLSRWVLVS